MVLYANFYRIESKYLSYLKPQGNLNTISIGIPIIQYSDNYTIHNIIMNFRDNLWLNYYQCAVRLLDMNNLNLIMNTIEDSLEEATCDKEDKEYLESLIKDIDKLYDSIEYNDRLAYVWIKN